MSEEINYKQLWDLAENNVRALEQERNELARQLGQEVARTQAALRMCEDWEMAYHDLEKKYNELMNAD